MLEGYRIEHLGVLMTFILVLTIILTVETVHFGAQVGRSFIFIDLQLDAARCDEMQLIAEECSSIQLDTL